MKLTWKTAAYIMMIGTAVVVGVRAMPYGLIYNMTDSIPLGLYWISYGSTPKVGDIAVVARPPAERYSDPTTRKHLEKSPYRLIKRVGALPGDAIKLDGPMVLRCKQGDKGCSLLGVLLEEDSVGAPLTAWPFDGEPLPAGAYYLGDPQMHPKSFDSRYLGPIESRYIEGTATPLFTWGTPAPVAPGS